jgi:hypothetical protein
VLLGRQSREKSSSASIPSSSATTSSSVTGASSSAASHQGKEEAISRDKEIWRRVLAIKALARIALPSPPPLLPSSGFSSFDFIYSGTLRAALPPIDAHGNLASDTDSTKSKAGAATENDHFIFETVDHILRRIQEDEAKAARVWANWLDLCSLHVLFPENKAPKCHFHFKDSFFAQHRFHKGKGSFAVCLFYCCATTFRCIEYYQH